ncbi:hypothetical protein BDP27DRAFT_1403101 [Rhodocollybia butyracea]|uniref:Uncharacterized protein n=1 Tax=Rhodocollybia butyracea TaxID=206335 RepID=A0A9P5PSS6_9AGAR|nr:hypothetical protein BDP27DRAFT_1403101 [Rhodocollybia butyracea]
MVQVLNAGPGDYSKGVMSRLRGYADWNISSSSALALRQIMRDIGREFKVQQVPLQQVCNRWRTNVLRSRCNGVPTTSIHVDAGYAGFYLSDVFSRVWEPYPVPEPPTRAETLNLTQMAGAKHETNIPIPIPNIRGKEAPTRIPAVVGAVVLELEALRQENIFACTETVYQFTNASRAGCNASEGSRFCRTRFHGEKTIIDKDWFRLRLLRQNYGKITEEGGGRRR